MDTQLAPERTRPVGEHGRDTTHNEGSHPVNAFRTRAARRTWPIVASLLLVASGVAFMFGWDPLVRHVSAWLVPGDLWELYRGAHYVGWGDLGGLYTPGTGIVAFPGMAVVLAPVAMTTGMFGMSESVPPILLAHPSAALVLMPIVLLVASSVIFACDALAERLGISRGRRIGLCFAIAVVAWPLVALWGHAEDALAIAFSIYAMVAILNGKWRSAGWLLGLAIVIQPLAALILPLFVAASPRGQRIALTLRSSVLSVVLVGIAFLGDYTDTYNAVVDQPAYPTANHVTPWLALAPKLSGGRRYSITSASIVHLDGRFAVHSKLLREVAPLVVTGGLGRTIYLIVAVLVGAYVWRRPQTPLRLVWLAAVVLAARCFFEAVICPYYLAPPLFLALVLLAGKGCLRVGVGLVVAAATSVFAYQHLGPWAYWVPIVVGLGALLALCYPDQREEMRPGSIMPATTWHERPPMSSEHGHKPLERLLIHAPNP